MDNLIDDRMSDKKARPLLKRLRSFEYMALDHICCEAADRIEELEVVIKRLANFAYISNEKWNIPMVEAMDLEMTARVEYAAKHV